MSFPYAMQSASASYPGTMGPFPTSSTVRYNVLSKGIVGPATVLSAGVSIDNGKTWSELDSAHAPVINGAQVWSTTQIGNTLWALFLDTMSRLCFTPFNSDGVGGGTWGGTITVGPTIDYTGGSASLMSCLRSQDGKIAFVVTTGSVISGAGGTINLLEFGVFDPVGLVFATLIALGHVDLMPLPTFYQPSNPLAMVEGVGGLIHVAFGQSTNGAFNPLLFQTVNTSGTLSTLQQIATTQFDSYTTVTCSIIYQASTGRVFLAYTDYWDGTARVTYSAVVAFSPSELNCVFTGGVNIYIPAATGGILRTGVAFAVNGSVVDLFIGTDQGSAPYTDFGYWLAASLGTPAEFEHHPSIPFEQIQPALFTPSSFGLMWGDSYWEQAAAGPKNRTYEA